MNKTAILRSLLLLTCCSTLLILIYTSQLGHLWANYTYILQSTSDYEMYHRRGLLQDFLTKKVPPVYADSCEGSRIGNISKGTTQMYNNTDAKPQKRTSKFVMARSRKSGYLQLDSNKELDLHCKQCALVFSSGHLLGASKGREIDRTECVIRQNAATVRNYINDVGMRTTVRVIGHSNFKTSLLSPRIGQSEILLSPQTRPSIIFVPWLYKEAINRTTNDVFKTARRLSVRFPKVKFFFQSDDLIREMDEMFMDETGLNRTEIDTWFSTGFLSVLFALDVCDNVICYGVSDADYCSREPKSQVSYHYYDKSKDRPLECRYTTERENLVKGGHKFLTERKLYARWAQHRNLTFRAPTWPKSAFNQTGEFESPYLNVYRKAKEDGSFADYVKAIPVNDPKPMTNDKVRPPLLRRFRVLKRRVPQHLLKKKDKT